MSNSATPMEMRPHQWSKERYPLMAHIARHPFIYASLLLHTLLLWIFFTIGAVQLEELTLAKNESLVQTSMQRATHSDMHRRVQEIQKIQALLEKSLSKASSNEAASAQPESEDAPQTPETPEQMMQRAKQLLTSIQIIEDKIKIKEMARVLQISEQQAEEKLQAGRAPDQPDAKKESLTLEQIEQRAREALAQRQRQLERSESGFILGGVRNFVQQAQELMVLDGSGGSAAQMDESDAWDQTLKGASLAGQSKDAKTLTTPAIKRLTLHSNSANTFGSGGNFAQRASINNWYIIGPFEDTGKASIDKKYPPEMAIDLDASYRGKFGRLLNWTYQHTNQAPMIPTLRGEFAVYYGYAEIHMESERDLWLEISADDAAKVWLNRRAVWVRSNEDQSGQHQLRVERRKLHFNKGRNTLLFKLYNGVDAMFFALALAGEAGG